MSWIGVDLDGTLAYWGEGHNHDVRQIGPPIPAMVARVAQWLAADEDVRIVTARVGPATDEECQMVGSPCFADFVAAQQRLIEDWCVVHLGAILPITATKDFHMSALWDDRAIEVVSNTGKTLAEVATLALGDAVGTLHEEIAALEREIADYKLVAHRTGSPV